jgi:hypothetical protein
MFGADVGDFESGLAVANNKSGAMPFEDGFVLELEVNGDGVSFEIEESMLGLLATGFPTDLTPSASTTSNGNVSQVGSGVSAGVLSTAKGGVSSQQNASSSGAQVVVNKTQAGSTGVSKASSQPEASMFSQQLMQKRLRAGTWSQQELVDLALSDLLKV